MTTLTHRQPPRIPFHPTVTNNIPSSSPAFGTPVHPLRPAILEKPASTPPPTPILPVLLPPATLRPLAFRTFTKKHNLTLTSSALQALASFIGKHCGAAWREDGLADPVLEEVARMWKRQDGGADVIVDGDGEILRGILKQLEGCMSGGRVVIARAGGPLNRQSSFVGAAGKRGGAGLQREESFAVNASSVEEEEDLEDRDARRWLKVVDAFEQPKMIYNPLKKHFEKSKTPSSFFPPPSARTDLFRQRYHILHQRVLRNEAFQHSALSSASQSFKITPITNLLGRSGSSHLLLGLLTISPTGSLTIADLTGSIALNLEHASPIDTTTETWLCPGMIVLVDGVYEEEFNCAGGNLGSMGGIGGTIGGRFVGLSIGAPRCETRAATLGLTDKVRGSDGSSDLHIGGGFGWVDFLGVGSERGVGSRMRKIEQRLLHPHLHTHTNIQLQSQQADLADPLSQPILPSTLPTSHKHNSNKLIILGELHLDNPRTLSALRRILTTYTTPTPSTTSGQPQQTDTPPLAFILLGSFTSRAAMSATSTSLSSSSSTTSTSNSNSGGAGIPDSIAYKESFDALAALLSDFPTLLRNSTWIFVPGDNDPWPSAFSAGASVPLPRGKVPEMFTNRVKRAFAAANTELGVSRDNGRAPGEAIFTTNPSRLTLFGPCHEIVLFRDDISGRLRRNAITLKKQQERENLDAGVGDAGEAATAAEGRGGDVEMSAATDDVTTNNDDPAETNEERDAATQPMDVDTIPPPPSPQPQTNTTTPTPSARTLTKTLLDQSHLSPFPLSTRPLHWSHAHTLSLYPLPTVLVLCDPEADAFVVGYRGVCVVNAGRVTSGTVVGGAGKGREEVRWVEVDVGVGRGVVRSL